MKIYLPLILLILAYKAGAAPMDVPFHPTSVEWTSFNVLTGETSAKVNLQGTDSNGSTVFANRTTPISNGSVAQVIGDAHSEGNSSVQGSVAAGGLSYSGGVFTREGDPGSLPTGGGNCYLKSTPFGNDSLVLPSGMSFGECMGLHGFYVQDENFVYSYDDPPAFSCTNAIFTISMGYVAIHGATGIPYGIIWCPFEDVEPEFQDGTEPPPTAFPGASDPVEPSACTLAGNSSAASSGGCQGENPDPLTPEEKAEAWNDPNTGQPRTYITEINNVVNNTNNQWSSGGGGSGGSDGVPGISSTPIPRSGVGTSIGDGDVGEGEEGEGGGLDCSSPENENILACAEVDYSGMEGLTDALNDLESLAISPLEGFSNGSEQFGDIANLNGVDSFPSCPAPITINAFGTPLQLELTMLCSVIDNIVRPFVTLFSLWISLSIVLGARTGAMPTISHQYKLI